MCVCVCVCVCVLGLCEWMTQSTHVGGCDKGGGGGQRDDGGREQYKKYRKSTLEKNGWCYVAVKRRETTIHREGRYIGYR